MTTPLLEGVPNVSDGRRPEVVDLVGRAFSKHADLLDVHTDADHDRTVYTLVGHSGDLVESLLSGAAAALATIDMGSYQGIHPAVGALDVCPVVWLRRDDQEAAMTEALALADSLGTDLELPVFLYGDLASTPDRRERSFFRRGGLRELAARMESGELSPDRGPPRPHPTAGATLVSARPPLVAFNLVLDSGDVAVAVAVAASLREAGGGPRGVRAIGLSLSNGRTQVAINVQDPFAVPLAEVVETASSLAAAHGASIREAELVGLAPRESMAGLPDSLPIAGFDPDRHLLEARVPGLQ
jgi:glutamate formiminotransferase / 5-formyltetrahydrofolate cyclo-ligase